MVTFKIVVSCQYGFFYEKPFSYQLTVYSCQFTVKETSSLVTGNWLLVTSSPITDNRQLY